MWKDPASGGVVGGGGRGYLVGMAELDYLKIAAAVLAANIATVALVYCLLQISKSEKVELFARPAFYFLAAGIVAWAATKLYI